MNVLLISLDTTRADHLGCYGYGRPVSPHLDRLAAGGTVFDRCFSPHIPTHPAHTGLFTGCDIYTHRIVAQGASTLLPDDVPTLAELLRARGYWTAAADNLGRWFSRGFSDYRSYKWAPDPDGGWRKAEAVTDVATDLLRKAASQPDPFFLFVHYWDPHTPYLPPAPFSRMFYGGDERDPRFDFTPRSLQPALNFPPFQHYFRQWLDGVRDIEFPKAQYDAEIAYMDCCLQRLFQRLDDLGLRESTLIVVTADHGEELDEHRMWFDHHGLYDTNLRVPLIFSLPGIVPAGRRVPGLVRLFDVAPTILDLVGAGQPANIQGRSLGGAFGSHPEPVGADAIFATECTWMRKRAVRTAQWKLIEAVDHPDIHGCPPVELYDLSADPYEQTNLAETLPAQVDELRLRLRRWRTDRACESGSPDPIDAQAITLTRIGEPKPLP